MHQQLIRLNLRTDQLRIVLIGFFPYLFRCCCYWCGGNAMRSHTYNEIISLLFIFSLPGIFFPAGSRPVPCHLVAGNSHPVGSVAGRHLENYSTGAAWIAKTTSVRLALFAFSACHNSIYRPYKRINKTNNSTATVKTANRPEFCLADSVYCCD